MLLKKLLLLLLCSPFVLKAQNTTLLLQGNAGSYYLNHSVGAKENLYSIGRMYNASPSLDIIPFNHLNKEDGLKIGQKLKIPLTASNFTQEVKSLENEVLVPIYIHSSASENLNNIATKFAVSKSNLIKWNKITNGKIPSSGKLMVGFLKVKKDLSPLASAAVVMQDDKVENNISAAEVKDRMKKDLKEQLHEEPVVIQESEKKDEKKEKAKPAVVNEKKEADKPVAVKEENAKPVVRGKESVPGSDKKINGGYFKTFYEQQVSGKTEEAKSGTAGVFKSTSGWEDGKYYCLFNDAPAGTILKITNSSNSYTVYAKVLDAIPDMKQNEGLILRLSNAAAAELGNADGNFKCVVNF